MRSALYELTLARLREFVRQPEALFWVFGFPILLALALGFAFREKGPDRVPIGIVEGDAASRLKQSLSSSPALLVRSFSDVAGREALRNGKISLLIESSDGVVYHFDPTRPDSRVARLEADEAIQRAAGMRSPVQVREEHVVEPGSRYIDFLLPGLLGMNLMGTGMWGVGFSIANARMLKLLKRLVATPMRKTDYLLSQILSRLVFLVLEVAALVIFGWLVFDIAVHGSLVLFSTLCLLGALAFSGLGILVSSRADTLEAVNGWMNLVMLPMWVLSGVFFSYERFPDSAKPLIRALPLTALNDALRAVINEGAGVTDVGIEIGVLVAWSVVSFVVALKIFRWR